MWAMHGLKIAHGNVALVCHIESAYTYNLEIQSVGLVEFLA